MNVKFMVLFFSILLSLVFGILGILKPELGRKVYLSRSRFRLFDRYVESKSYIYVTRIIAFSLLLWPLIFLLLELVRENRHV